MSQDRIGPVEALSKAATRLPDDLRRLEAESIHILREVAAERANPVLLYSIGKDSAVLLHLAMKAFAPGKPPFPLLHVDTTWKFREMIAFRDAEAKRLGLELLVHHQSRRSGGGRRPLHPRLGRAYRGDEDPGAEAGARQVRLRRGFRRRAPRRGEEPGQGTDHLVPHQRPPLGTPRRSGPSSGGSTTRASTRERACAPSRSPTGPSLDVWRYIQLEGIPIPSLYFAKPRPIVEHEGALIMVDDDRMPAALRRSPVERMVRFRTLGCYPLTGAVESDATDLDGIIAEMLVSRSSERQGRVIDRDGSTMESKKQDGYF